jgi:hypothetical protein
VAAAIEDEGRDSPVQLTFAVRRQLLCGTQLSILRVDQDHVFFFVEN